MRLLTIGFTKKSAESFFSLLTGSGAKRLVDVRLNNVSQLAGFAKKDDLKYFLRAICGIDYIHHPLLAPTQEMLDAYKKKRGDWSVYENQFMELIRSRAIETTVSRDIMSDACLLCSEEKPEHCHRRLVAEYLREKWGDVQIVHI
jgi:uncharacterized protein (DUF488 family)